MKRKLIAIAALAMAPALAMAQGGGGQAGGQAGGQGTGTGGGQQSGGGAGGAAGGAAGLVPQTREQQRQDSIIGAKRAQQGDTLSKVGGTVRTAGQQGQAGGQSGQVTESHGEVQSDTSGGYGSMSLTSDQVKQLQQALNDNGCNVGTPDGVMGPKTRQGIRCIKKQKNITGNNMNDVYQALNLDFSTTGGATGTTGVSDTTSTSTSSGEVSSDSASVRADKRQTSGANRGGIRPKADTTRMDTTTNSQATAAAAQHGKGMHDSSTSQTGAARDSTKPPR